MTVLSRGSSARPARAQAAPRARARCSLGAGLAALLLALPAFAPRTSARITALELKHVESPAFGGASFGTVGPYVRIEGIAHGEIDPDDPHEKIIQDLALAPRAANGKVLYATPFEILMPVDAGRSNHVLLYDVVNRGRPLAPGLYNRAVSSEAVGDGFLERQGFALVFSGWQGDLLPQDRFAFPVPVLEGSDGKPLLGRMRKEWALFHPVPSLDLGDTVLGHGLAYPAASLEAPDAVLTARVHAADPPEVIPRARWRLADCRKTPFPGTPSPEHLCLEGGFDTDHIYEFVYTARDPRLMGLGFAATRDLIAFLRSASADDHGIVNPLAGRIRYTIAHGTSQSGRFLRSFLDLGFNLGPDGKRVFDGMIVHVASQRIDLDQRFADPGTIGLQHEESKAAIGDFPFTWGAETDPVSHKRAGLLEACTASHSCPEIFQVLSSLEYWNGRAALDTTDGAGHDVKLPENVHVYHIAGTQHALGLRTTPCQFAPNPNSYLEPLRALLLALVAELRDHTPPPPSRYPRVQDATLTTPAEVARLFPAIPGVHFTGLVNDPPIYDRGPAFDARHEAGVRSEPPIARPTPHPVVLVPAIDGDGNERDGARTVTLAAPLGTYTGWNLRRAGYGEGDLCYLAGSFFPFARTRAERLAAGDPRPSLEERYGSHEGYVAAVKRAAGEAEREGFLLPEDAARLIAEAEASDVLR
jgi:hypothetical protein